MTKLLEKAFKKASLLPGVEQNTLARWMLKELEAEKKWNKILSESEDLLDKLADVAIKDYKEDRIKTLDLDNL